MIRLLHSSDWHLGRLLYQRSLLEDQSFILDHFLKLIDARKPHAVLISGDIFDRALPPEAAVTLFDRFLREAAGLRGLPVILIPGNHDSCERLGFASGLLRERGVTIFARIEDAYQPIRIRGDEAVEGKTEELLVYGIPFVEPVQVAQFLKQDDIDSPDQATRALCTSILTAKPPGTPAVLLCHGFVAGGETSESEKDIYIGGSSYIDPKAFAGFAYTALGHLHKPQTAGAPNIRYSGSLLPYSKSEVGHEKSVTEIRVSPSGDVEVELHVLPRLRDLRYVEGELNELIAAGAQDARPEDFIIAGYTDSGAVLDAFAKLRLHYPNLLHVSRAGGYVPDQSPALSRLREREELSELDLFAEFFQAATGEEMKPDERAMLSSTLETLSREERTL